jgi:hypothetical protein
MQLSYFLTSSTAFSGLACCSSAECESAYGILMDIAGPEMEEDPVLKQVINDLN